MSQTEGPTTPLSFEMTFELSAGRDSAGNRPTRSPNSAMLAIPQGFEHTRQEEYPPGSGYQRPSLPDACHDRSGTSRKSGSEDSASAYRCCASRVIALSARWSRASLSSVTLSAFPNPFGLSQRPHRRPAKVLPRAA